MVLCPSRSMESPWDASLQAGHHPCPTGSVGRAVGDLRFHPAKRVSSAGTSWRRWFDSLGDILLCSGSSSRRLVRNPKVRLFVSVMHTDGSFWYPVCDDTCYYLAHFLLLASGAVTVQLIFEGVLVSVLVTEEFPLGIPWRILKQLALLLFFLFILESASGYFSDFHHTLLFSLLLA